MRFLCVVALVLISGFSMAQEFQLTRTDEAWGKPQLSPDGTTVYALRASRINGRERRQIVSISLDNRSLVQPLTAPGNDYGEFRLSPNGAHIAATRLDETGRYQLYLISTATGGEQPITRSVYDHYFPAWSARGDKLAACAIDGRSAVSISRLAVIDLATSGEEVLTPEERNYWSPQWLGNDRIVASGDALPGLLLQQLFVVDLSAGNAVTALTFDSYWHTDPQCRPDGRTVVYVKGFGAYKQIWQVAADGSGNETPITTTPLQHEEPRVSPDGNFVAYRAQIGGDGRFRFPDQIFLAPLNTAGDERVLTSLGEEYDRGDLVWTGDNEAVVFASALADPFLRDKAQLRAVVTGLGCASGNVSSGSPPIALRTLAVNGRIGNHRHTIRLERGERIALTIAPPPAGPVPAPFVLYLTPSRNLRRSEVPDGIGLMCFASPLTGGAPLTIFNTLGRARVLGQPLFPASPAPFVFQARPPSFHAPAVTLQGLIRDRGALSAREVSVTNAITLQFQ